MLNILDEVTIVNGKQYNSLFKVHKQSTFIIKKIYIQKIMDLLAYSSVHDIHQNRKLEHVQHKCD